MIYIQQLLINIVKLFSDREKCGKRKDVIMDGNMGEKIAAKYLEERGYNISGRNYHSRYGEIDIIAEKGEYIVFVEVKARSQNFAGLAREAVDLRKQKKIIKTALMYLSQSEKKAQPRFDVVEVNQIGREYSVNHIENAFDLRGYDEAF